MKSKYWKTSMSGWMNGRSKTEELLCRENNLWIRSEVKSLSAYALIWYEPHFCFDFEYERA